MLTSGDVNFIKNNRADIVASRTDSVTFTRLSAGTVNVYTGETTGQTATTTATDVVWKELSVENVAVLQGVEIRKGDVMMTVDGAITIANVTKVTRGGIDYAIITYTERGLGGKNRYECVVRRVT
jgi:nicotinate-nucleotide pyrophosphorylase